MPLYRLHTTGAALKGTTDVQRALLHAVVKRAPANPYCLANEFICGTLARFLGLPAPPVAYVVGEPGVVRVAVLDFALAGQPIIPADLAACYRHFPSLCAGTALFDLWVGNGDRHAANVWADFGSDPPAFHIFDHDRALFGGDPADALARMASPDAPLAGCSSMRDLITTGEHFQHWLARIRGTPDYLIDDLCSEAARHGLPGIEADAAAGFLKHRRDRLPVLLARYPEAFPNVAWGSPSSKFCAKP